MYTHCTPFFLLLPCLGLSEDIDAFDFTITSLSENFLVRTPSKAFCNESVNYKRANIRKGERERELSLTSHPLSEGPMKTTGRTMGAF